MALSLSMFVQFNRVNWLSCEALTSLQVAGAWRAAQRLVQRQAVVLRSCPPHPYQKGLRSQQRDASHDEDWADESLDSAAVSKMADMMKRSKALRFYGLMGKRSGNKGEMFVGLMGRSITSGESLTQILPGASRAIGCVQGVP
ncbi:unnamed protein product [Arctogadus glacialis]